MLAEEAPVEYGGSARAAPTLVGLNQDRHQALDHRDVAADSYLIETGTDWGEPSVTISIGSFRLEAFDCALAKRKQHALFVRKGRCFGVRH